MSKRYPGGIIRKTPQTPSQTSAQGVWDMTSVTQAVKENTWPIAGVPDPVSKSLRFRSSASAYLNRTFGTPTNRNKWTWSGWVKRGLLSSSADYALFTDSDGSTSNTGMILYSNDTLRFYNRAGGVTNIDLTTTAVFRDPVAWYHVVLAYDSSQTTQANRVLLYVNGVNYTWTGTASSLNETSQINTNTYSHQIGSVSWSSKYFDGYLTEVNFIDGQALTPSSFGNTNDQTGVWQPIAYTGTYGTNGFYLPFSNTASTTTLGYDFSGNSNNWTPNNISLTSGSTYDSMVDVPTQWIPYNTAGDTGALYRGNYCVLNPLYGTGITANFYLDSANLNLNVTNNSGYRNLGATFSPEGFKGYCEVVMTTSPNFQIGFAYESISPSNTQYTSAGTLYIDLVGDVKNGSTTIQSGCTPSFSSGDILQIAFDFTGGARNVWFGRNGTWGSNSVGVGVPSTGTNPVLTVSNIAQASRFYFAINTGGGTVTVAANFGQRPFSYTPPSGYKSLCTTNLPTPTIGATASTQANKYFDVTLFTGTGANATITNSGSMQPDFIWGKSRSNAFNHILMDSVRGTGVTLFSNSTSADYAVTDAVTAFNSNGFNYGVDPTCNTNGSTNVFWQWRASNATAVTNTAGTITSTVSANTSAGFSIVTYTGTGVTGTLGHGLGVAPAMIIVKSRSNVSNWYTYHQSIGNTGAVALNLTNATITSANFWNNTSPTSTVFTASAGSAEINGNGLTYVAYCFAQIAGYSAFGSYTGNGSSDGPFVFTGFRPALIILKRTDTSGNNWSIFDKLRSNPFNVVNGELLPSSSAAESTIFGQFDFVSNGFKIRSTNGGENASGGTYIYAAFAESPFKYALAR